MRVIQMIVWESNLFDAKAMAEEPVAKVLAEGIFLAWGTITGRDDRLTIAAVVERHDGTVHLWPAENCRFPVPSQSMNNT